MVDKLVEVFERFFLDIVATVTPAILLLAGWIFLTDGRWLPAQLANLSQPVWWIWLPIAYLTGQLLTAVGEWFLVPLCRWLYGTWFGTALMISPRGYRKPDPATERPSLTLIKKLVPDIAGINVDTTVLRNVALTVIGSDNLSTIVRFRAISLCALGGSVATLLLVLLYIASHASMSGAVDWLAVGRIGLALFLILVLMRRYFEFASRSDYLQFDMLAGIILAQRAGIVPAKGEAPTVTASRTDTSHTRRRIVYLSGGLHSGWQPKVKASAPEFDYLDPSQHQLVEADAYTAWDLAAVRACDIVFAYLEKGNPSGFGLAAEIGYARALGKFIVFIDEKSATDPDAERRLQILQATASVTYPALAQGIEYLQQLGKIARTGSSLVSSP